MTGKKNELIAFGTQNNSVAIITNDLFSDIDFQGISAAIEKIGQSNGSLTTEEKEMANAIVSDWQHGVVGKLHTKNNEMNDFIGFFEVGSHGRVVGADKLEDFGELLADKTRTVLEYDALVAILEVLEDHQQTRPEQPIEREDRTYKESLEEAEAYRLGVAKYDLTQTRLYREVYQAERAWKKLVKENKEVKELLKKARRYNKDLGKFTDLARDKAQIAKLNITVSDKVVRESLRELLDFSIDI